MGHNGQCAGLTVQMIIIAYENARVVIERLNRVTKSKYF